MNKNFKLAIKSMIFTLIILVFSFLMFFVFNEGQKKLHGQAISVSMTKKSINLENGNRILTIEPDLEKTAEFLNFIYSNSVVLPSPFCFKDMAEFFAYSLF